MFGGDALRFAGIARVGLSAHCAGRVKEGSGRKLLVLTVMAASTFVSGTDWSPCPSSPQYRLASSVCPAWENHDQRELGPRVAVER